MITPARLRALWHSFRYCRVPDNIENIDKPTRILAASGLCVVPMTIYSVTIGAIVAYSLNKAIIKQSGSWKTPGCGGPAGI